MTYDEVVNRINQMTEARLSANTERLKNDLAYFCEGIFPDVINLGFSDLKRSIELLRLRVEQDGTRTVFVLIVGPLKSGKSTFVNLLADAVVSPMNHVECTMKPTFVVKSSDGTGRILAVNNDGNSTPNQIIENLINRIRNVESITELIEDATIDEVELNENNLIEQNLNEASVMNIVCSGGGTLLAENVYLVDMPGLDGAVANMQNIPYEDVAREVDSVIFVQSSGSINETSVNFLNRLSSVNGNIPVYLVHNFFDSAYWKTEEEKNAIRDSQVNNAVQELNNHNFLVDADNVFKINLGKVYDYKFRNEDINFDKWNNDDFESECSDFHNIQTIIHERLTNSTRLRYKNHIGRIWRQIEEIKRIIKEKIEIVKRYDEYKKEIDNQDYAVADMVKKVTAEILKVTTEGIFDPKYHFKEDSTFSKELENKVEEISVGAITQINGEDNDIFNAVNRGLASQRFESFKNDKYKKELDNWLTERVKEIIRKEIEKIEIAKKRDVHGIEFASFLEWFEEKIGSGVPQLFVDDLVFTYDYFKSYPPLPGRPFYTKSNYKKYVREMRKYLTGIGDGNNMDNDRLIHEKILKSHDFIEKYIKYLSEEYKGAVRRRKDELKDKVENKKLEVLYPDANNRPRQFCVNILNEINISLNNIHFGQ